MLSDKQIDANRKNSVDSTGPKTRAGKERARLNAKKHGLFARELTLNKAEKLEVEARRSALRKQLSPATPLQEIAFDRILCSLWRCQRALRLEVQRIDVTFDHGESPVQSDATAEGVLPTKWYAASGTDLRTAVRFLSTLRQDVEENGLCHAAEWKDPVIHAFGEEYFSLLTKWLPMNIDAIYQAEQLVNHAETFGLPLPEDSSPDSKKNRVTVDPRLSWQSAVKFIEMTILFLKDLARSNKLGTDTLGQDHRASALELATRYYTSATRDLERAVAWFQDLKEKNL